MPRRMWTRSVAIFAAWQGGQGRGDRAGERGRGQASSLHLRIAAYQRARTVSRGPVGTAIGTIGTIGTAGTGDAVMEHTSTSRLGIGMDGFGESWPRRVRICGTIGRPWHLGR